MFVSGTARRSCTPTWTRSSRRSSSGTTHASRPARDRRPGGGARGELRGEGVRCPHRDGCGGRASAVPPCDGRPAQDVGLRGGEQGGVPCLRGRCTRRRGDLDRRGLPRRPRDGAERRLARRDRGAPAAGRARAGRPADHGRGRADEVPRQGRERCREARRASRRAAGRGARLPPSARGRAALGRRPGHGREAPWPGHHDGRPARAPTRSGPRGDAGARDGTAPPRAGPQPRPAAGATAAPTWLDRLAARPGPVALVARVRRRGRRRPRRPGHEASARGAARRPHGRAPAPLRRLHACDPFPHAAAGHGRALRRSLPSPGPFSLRRSRSSSAVA